MIILPNLTKWKGDKGQRENQCFSLGYEGASEKKCFTCHSKLQITKRGNRKRTMGAGVLCQYPDPCDRLSYLLQRFYSRGDCDRAMVTPLIAVTS